MRVSKEKAAEHRQKIINSAARLFREKGIGSTGIDSITGDAGLTHGAVYSQFGSKEAIAIEAIRLALRDSKRRWIRTVERRGNKKIFPAIVESYLSERHRDEPGRGCLVAALAADVAREPRGVRDAFTEEFKESWKFLSALLGSEDNSLSEEDTLAAFSFMAGAMILARAVSDDALSERILKAAAKRIVGCAKSE
jgi:TetR/AcrR family transcriptional regulator, transcriptional repressor for nem operon